MELVDEERYFALLKNYIPESAIFLIAAIIASISIAMIGWRWGLPIIVATISGAMSIAMLRRRRKGIWPFVEGKRH